jgi:Protein of unknown function (DUF4038)
MVYIAGLAGAGGVNRYFADNNGHPRFMLLEQGWAVPWNGGRWNSGNWQSDFTAYFSNRSAQGYTAWYGQVWGSGSVDASALGGGRTYDGVYALTVNGTPGAISTGSETIALNNTFWTRVDAFFSTAATYGITCFLNLGQSYDFSTTNGVAGIWNNLSTTQAHAFGQALSTRYPQSSYPHVFWFYGDDGQGSNDSYFTQMLAGSAAAGDTRSLVSTEYYGETNSHIEFDTGAVYVSGGFGITNATYNWVYTYNPNYLGVEDSYTETGTTLIPAVWGDGPYYGDTDNSTPDYTERRNTWWALASGARGLNNTSGPSGFQAAGEVWAWQSGAVAALTSDPNGPWITGHIGNVISYFTSLRNWYKLVPDTSSVLVTAGRGTRGTSPAPTLGAPDYGDTNNYVCASRVADGSLAVIYCGQHFSITIDQTKMQAGYTATWVDPASTATQAAVTGSTYNSTPLGNNSAGNPDWVLALQGPAPPGPPAFAMSMGGV